MSDDHDLDERERALFAALPRETEIDERELDHLVSALKAEGFLQRPRAGFHWSVLLAASVLFALVGGVVGARLATRSSLEGQLARTDLSVADRILLMQRAGSAYVRASNSYASAVAQTDSAAVEVASRVLVGAAQAVARTKLDGGVAQDLTAALRAASPSRDARAQQVIWF